MHSINADINIHTIKSGEGKLVFTTTKDQENQFTVQKKDNILYIRSTNKNSNDKSSINLSQPNSISTLKVVSVSGDISIDDTILKNVYIETVSGNIDLNNTAAIQAKLKSVSGDILWQGATITTEITTISGNVVFNSYLPIAGEIHAQSFSGDVLVPKDIPKGRNLINIKSVSGDIHITNVTNN